MKYILYTICALLSLDTMAQNQSLFVTAGGGYTLHSGEHHSNYSSTLLSTGSYKADKKFTYAASIRAGYRIGNLGAGVGLETGNFQNQHSASIAPVTFVTLDGTVYTTGRYWTPHAFVQYRVPVWKGFYVEPGVSAGVFLTKASQGTGIGVFDIPSQYATLLTLAGISQARIGAQSFAGANGSSASMKAMIGAQLGLGYKITQHWAAWAEASYRYTKVDNHLDLAGISNVNVSYPMHYTTFRLGASFDFLLGKKAK